MPANGNLRAGAQEHPLSADEGHHAFSSQPIAARLLMGRKKSRSALKMMFAPGILLAFTVNYHLEVAYMKLDSLSPASIGNRD